MDIEDIVTRAQRLVGRAQESGLTVRLLGGTALYLLAPRARTHPTLKRRYKDIDLVTGARDGGKLTPIMESEGFTPDRRFNALHGETRLLYWDEAEPDFQVDVFVGPFHQCHTLDLLAAPPTAYTIHPTMLLLTKLQIVELNAKDIQDILVMVLDFPVGTEGLDRQVWQPLVGADWGLFTTVTDTLDKVRQGWGPYLTDHAEQQLAGERLGLLRQWADEAPKTLAWKLRARVGRKMPWYELPEEVRR
jgi:hypothetical protein